MRQKEKRFHHQVSCVHCVCIEMEGEEKWHMDKRGMLTPSGKPSPPKKLTPGILGGLNWVNPKMLLPDFTSGQYWKLWVHPQNGGLWGIAAGNHCQLPGMEQLQAKNMNFSSHLERLGKNLHFFRDDCFYLEEPTHGQKESDKPLPRPQTLQESIRGHKYFGKWQWV